MDAWCWPPVDVETITLFDPRTLKLQARGVLSDVSQMAGGVAVLLVFLATYNS